MTSLQNQASLFGLDLRPAGALLRAALVDMARWRLVKWMLPQARVAVRLADGRWMRSQGPQTGAREQVGWDDGNVATKARGHFVAIVPSEDVLLRWSVALPSSLSEAQRAQSLALEVAAKSPFPTEDSLWASQSDAETPGREHLVLASRRILAEHLSTRHATLLAGLPVAKGLTPGGESSTVEVWVPESSGEGFVVLPGFGETARGRRNRAGAAVSMLLLSLAVVVTGAIAVTPTAQLYLRLQAARSALQTVGKQAADAVELRQAMVREMERVKQMQQLLDQPVSPFDALLQVNRAVPDDAFLRNLEISGAKVVLTGEAPVSASLMTHLSNLPGFSSVRAPRPATRPAGAPRESFVIELQLSPLPVVMPEASQNASATAPTSKPAAQLP
ncbi:MAG: PilN domain-containing protein [Hydrogenophaga sp.]|nr:PilN domain-containing protein [Hydrogenophaga sp.]